MSNAATAGGFLRRGGLWVVAQTAFLLAVFAGAVAFRGDAPRAGLALAGAGLFVAGGCLGVAGVRALGRARTAFPKPREDSRLIQHGIYARVRHPLYTCLMLLSAGWALLWQSGPALGVALAQIPFFVAKARREERWLREQFPAYADYASRTPAFIPRFGVADKLWL
jgi:protein-S-isoprenylcysteine O-methyltransferase Ste14